jgi:hypothetical protein
MTIGADGDTTNTVTLENVEEVRTRNVAEGGQIYVGQDYAGEQILLAFRVQEQDDEQEDKSDSTDVEDTNN